MLRRPKRHPRDARSRHLNWECLEDRCLLSGLGGLLAPVLAPVTIAPPSPAPVVVATPTATPETTGPAPAAPVLGLLGPTGVGGLLGTGLPPANPISSGSPVNTPPGGGLPLGNALTGVLGQVEQAATGTLLNVAPVPSGGTSGTSASGGLLGLSLSAGLGLGGGSGTGVQLGAQVDVLGAPVLAVSAGASLGQPSTGPGVGVNAGLNLGGSQLLTLGVPTDPAPGPSGGPGGGGGLTLGVGGLGVDVNLGGAGPVSPAAGAPGGVTVVLGPTAGASGGASLDGNPGGGTGNLPVVSVPPVIVEPPVVTVPPAVGNDPGGNAADRSAPGGPSAGGGDVAPPVAEAPAVAAAVSAAQPGAGGAVPDRPAAPVAGPLPGDLFLSPDTPDPSRALPNEPATTAAGRSAAGGPAEDLGADALFADSSLWGAGNADLWDDGVVAELAAVTATVGRADGSATPAALAPGGALALPASQEAGLLTACVPYDVQSLDLAFRRLMDQLQSLGWDLSGLLARLPGTPWVLMFAAMAVTCEAGRRRLAQARRRLAAAGGAGGTLTWFPSLSTHEPGDEG